jgi:hypothetical protein
LEGKGKQRAEEWDRNIIKEIKGVCDGNGGDGEGRGFLEGKDRRVGFLCLGRTTRPKPEFAPPLLPSLPHTLVHKITNVMYLFFICGWTNGFGWGEIHFSGRLKEWALKSRLFWAQMALRALVAISGPTPSNGPPYGFPPSKSI